MAFIITISKIKTGSKNSFGLPSIQAITKEMMAATPNSDLNLVLQVGGCTDFRNNYMTDGITQRFSIANGNIEKLSDLGDVSMVEPETLEDFVKFSKENYPAEKYIT